MSKFHILNQFLWPDAAPTGIYAEQLADQLQNDGEDVVLVGGQGSYRRSARRQPKTPIIQLSHFLGKRSSLVSTLCEYISIGKAYELYIRRSVRKGDLVVATSAPPSTLRLHRAIREQEAISVYWLQDFYPELVRGIWEYPSAVRKCLTRWWLSRLDRWDHVVKAAGNLPGVGPHYRVIRNWPTVKFGQATSSAKKTALYTGNLGYCHDLDALVEECKKLRAQGFHIQIHADGVRANCLPEWIEVAPPFATEHDLVAAQMAADVHLVAAHPRIQGALFPSKLWNCLASGKRIVASGFTGEMLEEFRAASNSRYHEHQAEFSSFLQKAATSP